jgi:hypothetical protein
MAEIPKCLPVREVPETGYRTLYDFLLTEFPEHLREDWTTSQTIMAIMRHYRTAYHNLRQVVPGSERLGEPKE